MAWRLGGREGGCGRMTNSGRRKKRRWSGLVFVFLASERRDRRTRPPAALVSHTHTYRTLANQVPLVWITAAQHSTAQCTQDHPLLPAPPDRRTNHTEFSLIPLLAQRARLLFSTVGMDGARRGQPGVPCLKKTFTRRGAGRRRRGQHGRWESPLAPRAHTHSDGAAGPAWPAWHGAEPAGPVSGLQSASASHPRFSPQVCCARRA